MNEKRFKVNYEKFTENEYLPCGLIDMGENSHIYKIEDVCDLLNKQQEQLDVYNEAILTMLGLLADKGIIFSGVKDE